MAKTKSEHTAQDAGQTGTATLLEEINSPADLRRLQPGQLPEVCSELREFMIRQLSVNPGHFASSMGAVELTVALHYVFDTPYDRIVWDVGHQAYGHKILTGRRDRFDTNRKFGGLSGFPNPAESEYDTFTAGHASNSISAALGMAVASAREDGARHRNVVAVIGDASISTGLAFEGLNNAANTPNDLLIILNDNDMSIDHNVGALHRYLTHLPTTKGYNRFRYKLYRMLRRMHLVSESRRGFILRFNNSIKSLLGKRQNIFEGLNIRYFGPFDGHDVERIVRTLNDIKDMRGPRLLHLRTVKGKGYAPAERDPSTWHAPGKFDAATGQRAKSDKPCPPKYQEVFGQTLTELARTDRRIVGITAAMLSGTSMSLMAKEMPDRVFDVGISEGHAVTFAGGLATEGMRPFVAIYSSFLQRAYDNIVHDVAIQGLPVTLCIDRAGLVGEDGVTHHGVYDMAWLREIPGMVVCSPRDEMQLRNLLNTAAHRDSGPMAIRYPRGAGHNIEWRNEMQLIETGTGELLSDDGDIDVALLTIGPVAREAARAAEAARTRGVRVAHWDMRFVKPLDEAILADVASRGCAVVTCEDGSATGGLGTAVTEWLNDHGHGTVRVRRIGIPDCFVAQGTPAELYRLCGMDADAIADALAQAVQTVNYEIER